MGEAPVGAVVERLGRPQAAVSLHLSQLRRVGLVAGERRGREVWYRVDNPRVFTMLECIRKGCGG
jgi:DNA-binding transcriptional ArsR family regulator